LAARPTSPTSPWHSDWSSARRGRDLGSIHPFFPSLLIPLLSLSNTAPR
jgi:hypothetical protein